MNNNDIAILFIVIMVGVFLSVTSKSNKPKKTSETYDEEVMSWESGEFSSVKNLPTINQSSDSKREIPGVNEYGIDPTVFDFSSIDIGSLDPIDDYHVIGFIAAAAEEEAQAEAEAEAQGQNDEDFSGW